MILSNAIGFVVLGVVPGLLAGAAEFQPSSVIPPKPAREFRGVWVATVGNIDWPSRPGLSTAEQKAELLAILDRAAALRMNAVLLQVRPACDALYASPIEPWSEHLTGTMGRAPSPYYDPLAFAVEEAHRRGLELHAWFNPYRAIHFASKSPVAANHISRTHPELVRRCGKYLWLDPGEPEVRDYTLGVVMDVVRRYDIDGVHFDDYFYPDPADTGAAADFPDDASWRRYGGGAGRAGMARADWRRENVNQLIERVYRSIKAEKPWVKFGISPFGIWRPGFPPRVRGSDAFVSRYADSRKWLARGWVDYLVPQLYWPVDSRDQSFPALLNWWAEQNTEGRHLWPGLAAFKAPALKPDEIPAEIRLARARPGVSGYVLYNMSSLMRNDALARSMERDVNTQLALVPASPWLGASPPPKPVLLVGGTQAGGLKLWLDQPRRSEPGATNAAAPARGPQASETVLPRWWLLQTRTDGNWTTQLLPGSRHLQGLGSLQPEAIALTAIDRFGNASPTVSFEKKEPEPAPAPKAVKRRRRVLLSPHASDANK